MKSRYFEDCKGCVLCCTSTFTHADIIPFAALNEDKRNEFFSHAKNRISEMEKEYTRLDENAAGIWIGKITDKLKNIENLVEKIVPFGRDVINEYFPKVGEVMNCKRNSKTLKNEYSLNLVNLNKFKDENIQEFLKLGYEVKVQFMSLTTQIDEKHWQLYGKNYSMNREVFYCLFLDRTPGKKGCILHPARLGREVRSSACIDYTPRRKDCEKYTKERFPSLSCSGPDGN